MSHFATVQTRITDLACLKQALADLGHAVEEGAADVRGYRGAREKADLVVRTGSAYDVGVRRVGDAYELVADWWGVETGTGITQEQFVTRLTQRYAYHKVLTEVRKRGFTVTEEQTQADQTIKVVVRKWS
jgi:hypothetical protein